jgi:hypothetical protein
MLWLCFDRIKPFYFEYIIVISDPTTFVVPHLLLLPQDSINIKPSPQIHTYDAEDGLLLLNYRDEDVTLDHPAEIRKQSATAEVEEPENELKDRAMTVFKFTVGLGYE